MRRISAIPLVCLVLGACMHEPTAPPASPTGVHLSALTFVDCPPEQQQLLPDQCQTPGASGGWPYFGIPDDGLNNAPNDPYPAAPGVWLGDTVTAATCFADQNRAIVQSGTLINDADKDWLADNCEYDLAYAFAPRMLFDFGEPCPVGEPYWAAKYFPQSGVVRIAYLPSYWDDCGEPILGFIGNDHSGDSEYILLEVGFDAGTRHWVFRQMWLSAHSGEPTDHSEWVPSSVAEFKYHAGSRPNVWVSLTKHANYKSFAACNYSVIINSVGTTETCGDPTYVASLQPIRFPTKASHNLGSRFAGTQCVPSEVPPRAGNGRKECYYYHYGVPLIDRFCGWTTSSAQYGGCATTYYNLLTGDKYENRFGDAGPGPNPPVYQATIVGPPAVEGGSFGTWSVQTFAGFAPYSYQWSVNATPAGSDPTLQWGIDAGATYQVSVVVRDALGHTSSPFIMVVGTGSNGCLIC